MLDCSGAIVNGEEDAMCKILKICFLHGQLRSDDEQSSGSPSVLPLAEVMYCMSQLIGATVAKVEQLAVRVIIALCEASSGEEG